MTPPGTDPGTVRLVAQCLNHYATPGPLGAHMPYGFRCLRRATTARLSVRIVGNYFSFIFTVVPCILILSQSFIYQLTHNRVALKEYYVKFTLKQLLHVSVQSPSSGSVLFELAKVIVIKIIS